jgi:hypothetical protein
MSSDNLRVYHLLFYSRLLLFVTGAVCFYNELKSRLFLYLKLDLLIRYDPTTPTDAYYKFDLISFMNMPGCLVG